MDGVKTPFLILKVMLRWLIFLKKEPDIFRLLKPFNVVFKKDKQLTWRCFDNTQ
jgi:hypothetical protein